MQKAREFGSSLHILSFRQHCGGERGEPLHRRQREHVEQRQGIGITRADAAVSVRLLGGLGEARAHVRNRSRKHLDQVVARVQ